MDEGGEREVERGRKMRDARLVMLAENNGGKGKLAKKNGGRLINMVLEEKVFVGFNGGC